MLAQDVAPFDTEVVSSSLVLHFVLSVAAAGFADDAATVVLHALEEFFL